jgi:hypothetical protein
LWGGFIHFAKSGTKSLLPLPKLLPDLPAPLAASAGDTDDKDDYDDICDTKHSESAAIAEFCEDSALRSRISAVKPLFANAVFAVFATNGSPLGRNFLNQKRGTLSAPLPVGL